MTVDRYRGKKTSLSIPLDVYQKIETLASEEKRSISQQIVILVEKALDPSAETEALKFLQSLAQGKRPSNSEIIMLAHTLQIDTEQLLDLVSNCLSKEAKC